MAKPTTLSFGKFIVLLGDGANTEAFTAPCGFTDRSLEIKASTSSTDVPDCDNPDAPAWTNVLVKSLQASVTGQGVLSAEAFKTWQAWSLSGLSKDVRVQMAVPLANNGGYFQGPAVLTSFKMDASYGEKVKVSVQMDGADQWTWTPAAA